MVKNRRFESGLFGVRHLQTFLLFLCLTIAYAMRVNLSVAIVAMVDRNSTNPNFEEYDWDEKTQSVILSSFFWGYIVTQVPAGKLAQTYGAKIMLIFAMAICSVLNILTPLGASYGGWKLVCASRVFQGLCQGFIFPSTHTLLSKWAPVSERGKLSTYCYSGAQFGTVIMLSASGFLASSFLGWPSVFYVAGFAGVFWSVLWYFFGGNSPSEFKSISPEEKEFIEKSLNVGEKPEKRSTATPWMQIFTSLPFLSLMLVHCGHNWGFWTLLTKIPTYMKNVLDMDIKQNALLSALPYLAMCLMSYVFSYLADVLSRREVIPLSVSRKLFNSIGHLIPMFALVALGYVTKDNVDLAVGLLTIAVGINSATYLGFQVNHIDLAPNHAGVLMGITNGAANVMSIIAPLLVGFVVQDSTDPYQWRLVFFISAAIYLVGNTLFVIFGRTEIQTWNNPEPKLAMTAKEKEVEEGRCQK
ncbi:putative inorganic phosphate cotransporter isoform X2 [Phlebotomus argentipes]|uniref:putative inorganic phosphate cotransporter isoform X2 n=1 Tax=Phlebotomus argentipes TaxID=94469 RepID=UPI0028929E34|nr:putative inorganic phosphate cotransporter isoform X2 [Phlebotomus argentipes]